MQSPLCRILAGPLQPPPLNLPEFGAPAEDIIAASIQPPVIYINNSPEIARQIKMVMYADDTTLYCNLWDLSGDIINNELTS